MTTTAGRTTPRACTATTGHAAPASGSRTPTCGCSTPTGRTRDDHHPHAHRGPPGRRRVDPHLPRLRPDRAARPGQPEVRLPGPAAAPDRAPEGARRRDGAGRAMRYAIVLTPERTTLETVQRYMGGNYTATRCGQYILISGEDIAGWTLDGYIIPRLVQWNIGVGELTRNEWWAVVERVERQQRGVWVSGQWVAEPGSARTGNS